MDNYYCCVSAYFHIKAESEEDASNEAIRLAKNLEEELAKADHDIEDVDGGVVYES